MKKLLLTFALLFVCRGTDGTSFTQISFDENYVYSGNERLSLYKILRGEDMVMFDLKYPHKINWMGIIAGEIMFGCDPQGRCSTMKCHEITPN